MPWVLSDYSSNKINLSDPNVYRDLSRPMGALNLARATYFSERYAALSSTVDDLDPFHYGTHYSCSGYVLQYLVRMQPFSDLARQLQGV